MSNDFQLLFKSILKCVFSHVNADDEVNMFYIERKYSKLIKHVANYNFSQQGEQVNHTKEDFKIFLGNTNLLVRVPVSSYPT